MNKTKFTIDEIRHYLEGCLISKYTGPGKGFSIEVTENKTLKWAIVDLEDPEDGIVAVVLRKKKYESKISKEISNRSHKK